jgi:TolB-like protein
VLRNTALWLLAFAALAASAPARAQERIRVALLPVVVHSGEGREYLQQGMSDMLVSRLGRDRRLAVIPIEDAATATTEVAAARKVGVANDAAYVVFGSLTRFGEGASLDLAVASVADDKREPRKIYVHADSMGALIPLLDGAAERTAGAIHGDGELGVAAAPVAPSATSELQELRRRVDALERAVYDNQSGSRPEPGAGRVEIQPQGQREPGLPSDRDGEPRE